MIGKRTCRRQTADIGAENDGPLADNDDHQPGTRLREEFIEFGGAPGEYRVTAHAGRLVAAHSQQTSSAWVCQFIDPWSLK
jgi:hypothetical protein